MVQIAFLYSVMTLSRHRGLPEEPWGSDEAVRPVGGSSRALYGQKNVSKIKLNLLDRGKCSLLS